MTFHVLSQFSLAVTHCFSFLLSLLSTDNFNFLSSLTNTPFLYEIQPLHSLSISQTPNGFTHSSRGWNSFGLQANPLTNPNFVFNQHHVMAQCDILASPPFSPIRLDSSRNKEHESKAENGFYTYCSLDSGWSAWDHGDEHGRIIADKRVFDIPSLAEHLHKRGLQLGLYVVPGGFHRDMNKTIVGTNITIGDVCSGDNGLLRCNWHYGKEGVQQWHDSVVELFARWGVDFIKLDFVTPGSPMLLPKNSSGSVIAYHTAISNLPHTIRRPIRLAISWKLARDPTHFSIWSSHADSFRTDQDVNNAGSESALFTRWEVVQRAIDNYRQYIEMHTRTGRDEVLSIYPDMDNMYAGNGQEVDGVDDGMRRTIVNHWVGAGANLMLGSDLTNLDETGLSLLTNPTILSIASNFTSRFPMRPRNPGTGLGHPKQLQSWIAGPNPQTGEAIVLLVNYGPDLGQGGFGGDMEFEDDLLNRARHRRGSEYKVETDLDYDFDDLDDLDDDGTGTGEWRIRMMGGRRGRQSVWVSSRDLGLGLGRVGEAGGALGMQWEVRDAWGNDPSNFLGVLSTGNAALKSESRHVGLRNRPFSRVFGGYEGEYPLQSDGTESGVLDVTPGMNVDGYGTASTTSGRTMASVLMANLGEGESVLLMLKPVGPWKA